MVFGNNGSGVRGDLKAVWTAILTDEEARAMPTAADTLFGKLREPIVRLRTGRAPRRPRPKTATTRSTIFRACDKMLSQSPLRSPSVFNFFRPGYVPPNTDIATAGKQAPEFQLHNESSTVAYINFMQACDAQRYRGRQTRLHDAAAHCARCCRSDRVAQPAAHRQPVVRRNAGRYSRRRSGRSTLPKPAATSAKLDLLATACFLILISPDYLVQK